MGRWEYSLPVGEKQHMRTDAFDHDSYKTVTSSLLWNEWVAFLKRKKIASNPDTSLNNCSFEKYVFLISPTVKMALVLTTVLHLQLIMGGEKRVGRSEGVNSDLPSNVCRGVNCIERGHAFKFGKISSFLC